MKKLLTLLFAALVLSLPAHAQNIFGPLNRANSWTAVQSFQAGLNSNGPFNYWLDTGLANAYVISPTPVAAAYTAGQTYWLIAANANNGASTLNVDGLGVKPLTKTGSTALSGGEISAGQVVLVTYDGTEFQLTSGVGTGGGGSGTVTSVAMTVPSWLAVAGSPLTSFGILAITAASGQTSHKVIGTGSGSSFGPVTLGTGDLPFTYSGNTTELGTLTGALVSGHTIVSDASGNLIDSGTTGGSGTVTSFSAGTLSPLFTTSVATGTSTPALSFSLSNFAAHKFFGNNTGSTAAPGAQTIGTGDLPFTYSGNTTTLGTTTGTLTNGHCVSIDASANLVDSGQLGCGGGGAGGTVTSVGLAVPTGFQLSGSPVLTSGTLTFAMPSSWAAGDLLLGNGANSVTRLPIGANGTFLTSNGTTASWGNAVTSVGQSFTGGLISVSGSPVLTTGTLGLTVAGTSGGVPYFSSGSTWASSGALTANLPVLGGGPGVAPSSGSRSGNTTTYATTSGSLINGHCTSIDASGNLVDAGAACGSGGGGSIGGSGTTNFLPKFNSSTTLTNSSLQDGTLVTAGANFAWPSNAVTFSATPVFDASKLIQNLTLTGNVSSSTVSNSTTGALMSISVCQDGTGSRTFVWPTTFLNTPPVQSIASQCTRSLWRYDGTNWIQPDDVASRKPPMLDAGSNGGNGGAPQCYAAPWGNNSNDGLSWGSAKFSVIEGCYDAIPIKGGEIYIARGAAAQIPSGFGIWIMGANDPNYASPPTGWRQQKQGPVRFVGVAGDNQGAYFEFGGGRINMSNCGTSADNNHPCVWMSNTTIYLEFRNLMFNSAGRGVLIGEFSDHTRVPGGSGGGSNDFLFENDYFGSTGVNNGPPADVFGTTFWNLFENCGFASNSQAVSSSDRTGAAFLEDQSTVQITHSAFDGAGTKGSGSWMVYTASGNSAAIGEHLVSEANIAPMIWFRDTGGLNGIMARFSDLQMSDSQPFNTPAVENDSPGSKPDQIVVDSAQIDNTSVCPVQGPMTLLGGIQAQASTCPPLYQGQQGITRGRFFGQEDTYRRNFAPTVARFTNLAAQQYSSWTISVNGSVASAAAPDGTSLAGRVSSSSGTVTAKSYQSGSMTFSVGDVLMGGCWIRSNATPSGFAGNTPCNIGVGGATTGNFTGNLAAPAAYNGANEWQWVHTRVTVAVGFTGTVSWNGQVDVTHQTDFYAPVFIYLPVNTVSPTEAAEIEWRLASYPDTASVGDVSTLRGQRFSFGTPTSTRFGKFAGNFTADRVFTWPDQSGTPALTTQLPGLPVYDNFSSNDVANYTTGNGGVTINTGSQTLSGNAANAFANRTDTAFLNNQFAEVLVSSVTGLSGGGIMAATVRSLGYFCGVNNNQVRLSGGGIPSAIIQSATIVPGSSLLRAEAIGTTITCYIDNVAIVSTTDSVVTSGSPGVYFVGTNGSFGSFAAGSIPTYAVLSTEQNWDAIQHFRKGLKFTANGYEGQLSTSALSANRTYTFPDTSLTVAGTNVNQTWTGVPTFSNGIISNGVTIIPTGPLIFGGNMSTCGSGTAGQVKFCLGDSTTNTGQLSENNDPFKSFTLWNGTAPTQLGLLFTTTTTPPSSTVPYVDSAAGITIDSTGDHLTKYHSTALAGNGIPGILYSNDLAAQSANVGSTTMFTTPASGSYSTGLFVVHADIVCTTGQATTTVGLTAAWNNGSGAQTNNLIPNASSCASTGSEFSASLPIYSGASLVISFSTTTANFTTGRYAVHIRLESK